MASQKLVRTDCIPQIIKDTVNGYIKLCEYSFKSQINPSSKQTLRKLQVPEIITYWILLYYYVNEFFSDFDPVIIKTKDNDIQKVIEKIGDTGVGNTVYGKIEITNKYKWNKWTFKVIDFKRGGICIGIDGSNKLYLNESWYDDDINTNKYYAIEFGLNMHEKFSIDQYCGDYAMLTIKSNDIIKMELNTFQNTLRYYVNDYDLGIAFDNIDFYFNRKYFMAVSMRDYGQILKLLSFEQY